MSALIKIKTNIEYCEKFNFSTDENYKKGYAKAFELIKKSLP